MGGAHLEVEQNVIRFNVAMNAMKAVNEVKRGYGLEEQSTDESQKGAVVQTEINGKKRRASITFN